MTRSSAAFVEALGATLPRHAAVLDRLIAGVEADAGWRWLELGCSVAEGRGDEWSDLDVAVGAAGDGDAPPLAAAEGLVRSLGAVVDLLVHELPGRPAHRRIACELADGVQLDLVVFPAGDRPGLPPGSVALVDKDGTLGEPWVPGAHGPPPTATAREWAFLAWWALSDAAKYLRRGAAHEAVERIAEARRLALQLHAAAEGVAYSLFGLTSILDEAEPPMPAGLDATYPSGLDPVALHRAATATAALVHDAVDAAAGRLGVALDVPLAKTAGERLAAARPMVPELHGALARLRVPEPDDVEPLAAIRRQPEVNRWWRGGEDMVAAVEEDLAEKGTTAYVVEVDGRVAGWIQWQAEEEPDYRSASIDIYLDRSVHGRGIGTDAVRTVVRHLIEDHGHHRLTIDPATENVAAVRSYTKVGFRPVGVQRRSERGADGSWHDGLLMDLLAGELTDG